MECCRSFCLGVGTIFTIHLLTISILIAIYNRAVRLPSQEVNFNLLSRASMHEEPEEMNNEPLLLVKRVFNGFANYRHSCIWTKWYIFFPHAHFDTSKTFVSQGAWIKLCLRILNIIIQKFAVALSSVCELNKNVNSKQPQIYSLPALHCIAGLQSVVKRKFYARFLWLRRKNCTR